MKRGFEPVFFHPFGQCYERGEDDRARTMGNSRYGIMTRPGHDMGQWPVLSTSVLEWRARTLRGTRGERCPCVKDYQLGLFDAVRESWLDEQTTSSDDSSFSPPVR